MRTMVGKLDRGLEKQSCVAATRLNWSRRGGRWTHPDVLEALKYTRPYYERYTNLEDVSS
jgi:hypothetical protein